MSKFKIGDKVRVKKSIKEPRRGWGAVEHSSVGTIRRISESRVMAVCDFPEQRSWNAVLSDMEKVNIQLENK